MFIMIYEWCGVSIFQPKTLLQDTPLIFLGLKSCRDSPSPNPTAHTHTDRLTQSPSGAQRSARTASPSPSPPPPPHPTGHRSSPPLEPAGIPGGGASSAKSPSRRSPLSPPPSLPPLLQSTDFYFSFVSFVHDRGGLLREGTGVFLGRSGGRATLAPLAGFCCACAPLVPADSLGVGGCYFWRFCVSSPPFVLRSWGNLLAMWVLGVRCCCSFCGKMDLRCELLVVVRSLVTDLPAAWSQLQQQLLGVGEAR
ncbi:hypothetical protein SEVIR_4G253550v4 [Setaria viridis]